MGCPWNCWGTTVMWGEYWHSICYYVNPVKKQLIGFIGQGFIGKHMADDFENRGYEVVRYALEEPYTANKDQITKCDITFVAVPTPTTPDGFDFSIIRSAMPLIGKGKIVVIKSTILPGTTEKLQAEFPDIHVMHSPEFLREKSAAEDTAHPERNIIGVPTENTAGKVRGGLVLSVLPPAPYSIVTTARNAECIKYIGNAFLYAKLVFMNIAHDFTKASGAEWETVRQVVGRDDRIGQDHTQVIFDNGRGAGGHCFIKDFEALLELYETTTTDKSGVALLKAFRNKNNQLLLESNKDIDLLESVYGKNIPT